MKNSELDHIKYGQSNQKKLHCIKMKMNRNVFFALQSVSFSRGVLRNSWLFSTKTQSHLLIFHSFSRSQTFWFILIFVCAVINFIKSSCYLFVLFLFLYCRVSFILHYEMYFIYTSNTPYTFSCFNTEFQYSHYIHISSISLWCFFPSSRFHIKSSQSFDEMHACSFSTFRWVDFKGHCCCFDCSRLAALFANYNIDIDIYIYEKMCKPISANPNKFHSISNALNYQFYE